MLDHLDALRLGDAIEVIMAACGDVEGTKTAVANRAILIWSDQSTCAALMNADGASNQRAETARVTVRDCPVGRDSTS